MALRDVIRGPFNWKLWTVDKKTQKDVKSKKAKAEPEPGKGVRSLETWKKLAAASRNLSKDEAGRSELSSDPGAYFRRFGLEDLAPEGDRAALTELEERLAGLNPFEQLGMDSRRGVVAVVAVPVAAVTWTKATNVQIGGNLNVGVNANVVKNANAACGYGYTRRTD